jgi:hypothetical protein
MANKTGTFKRVNISTDSEKTKERIKEIWDATKSKKTLVEAIGVSNSTMHKAYKNGVVSANFVLPFAEAVNVDPFYFTGESDDQLPFSEEIKTRFIKKHSDSPKPNRTRRTKKSADVSVEPAKPAKPVESAKPAPEVKAHSESLPKDIARSAAANNYDNVPAIDDIDLPDEDLLLLLRASLIKAKAGGKHATFVRTLKTMLISQ